ncbi:MAG: VOC family protein [Actinobacteria bacterium]|nr:MAG: VOC family protein [Actinomycetota bacterium]
MAEIAPTALDHVALWVAGRDTLAAFLCDHLGMHEIERTGNFTLVGADARLGKITLFDAEGPREPGVLGRVVLAVSDLDSAVAALPNDLPRERHSDDLVAFEGPEGLGLGLERRESPQVEYDLSHVLLRVPDPARARGELLALGFEEDGERLAVAEKSLLLEVGDAGGGERPLLNHLALLVDSAQAVSDEAESRGLEIADFVDAENTIAVFVMGPDGIKLEYVEHKPSFSLV